MKPIMFQRKRLAFAPGLPTLEFELYEWCEGSIRHFVSLEAVEGGYEVVYYSSYLEEDGMSFSSPAKRVVGFGALMTARAMARAFMCGIETRAHA